EALGDRAKRKAAAPHASAFTPDVRRAQSGGGGVSSSSLKANGIGGVVPQAARGRAQDYRATLTVRLASVGRMSDAMKAAINATRAWGGYVVSAQYDVPGHDGDAQLIVKVPVEHV